MVCPQVKTYCIFLDMKNLGLVFNIQTVAILLHFIISRFFLWLTFNMLRIYFNMSLFFVQITLWNCLLLPLYFTYVPTVHAKCYILPLTCLFANYTIVTYKYNAISLYKRTV